MVLTIGISFQVSSQSNQDQDPDQPDVIAVGCKFTGKADDRCSHGGYNVTKCVPEEGAKTCGYNLP